jgi:hypothetical protein
MGKLRHREFKFLIKVTQLAGWQSQDLKPQHLVLRSTVTIECLLPTQPSEAARIEMTCAPRTSIPEVQDRKAMVPKVKYR